LGVERTSKTSISIPTPEESFSVIDLFSGIGGMSLGFTNAKFDVNLAIDNNDSANAEYERNLGKKPVSFDLFTTSSKEIMGTAGIEKGDLDILVGCPPCQGFTQLRGRNLNYRTNDLVTKMANLAVEIEPSFVVFENVPGILTKGKQYFDEYLSILSKGGYCTVHGKLQAADFGVPQRRTRVIAISTKINELKENLELPKPTHCKPKLAKKKKLKPWRTVRDTISHLPPLKSGERYPRIVNHEASKHNESVLRMIKHVPHDGGNRIDIPRKYWLQCHKDLKTKGAENIYGRMHWDQPSLTLSSRCTVPACGRFIHPEQDRGMTIREALLLQTFPRSYKLGTGLAEAARLVGNAMPVLFAEKIAHHLRNMLEQLE